MSSVGNATITAAPFTAPRNTSRRENFLAIDLSSWSGDGLSVFSDRVLGFGRLFRRRLRCYDLEELRRRDDLLQQWAEAVLLADEGLHARVEVLAIGFVG